MNPMLVTMICDFCRYELYLGQTYTLVEKERALCMNEVKQEQPQEVMLPIEWHIPEDLQGHYANNVIVQPGQFEINLFFFESRIPPFAGQPEASREYLLKQGSVRFECVGKMTVDPQLVPEFIKALQIGLDNYNASKSRSEREASK